MPSTPHEIRAMQARRFAYLKFVYDDSQRLPDGESQSLNSAEIRSHLGLDPDEAHRIEEYLTGRHLLEYVAMGPYIAITTYGVDYIEDALAAPDRDTEFFPAINVLHIEQVINSQIQQGTTNSQQTGEWKGIAATELASIVADIRSMLSTVTLKDDQREDAEAHLSTLEAHSKARRPNQTVIRESLASLRTIAEQVGGTLLAGKIAGWLEIASFL